ncbi:hypothetical protein LCGC14_1812830 [marine sediment metagenome]|uniref:Uncharacterized protein n=1 Tax=marine sediment metagenome TaxID=412755 RepID=A0A0F9JKV5_9ZZZZ
MTAYNVSSFFLQQTGKKSPILERQLAIGDSDYSGRVIRWPSFRRKWNDIRPVSLTIGLANEDQALNFFRDDPTAGQVGVTIKAGFKHPGENLLIRSENFDVDSWQKNQVDSLEVNAEISPMLLRTADVVQFASAQGATLVQFVQDNLKPNTQYTYAMYIRTLGTLPSSDLQVNLRVFDDLSVQIGNDLTSNWQQFLGSLSTSASVNSLSIGLTTNSYSEPMAIWGALLQGPVTSGEIGEYIRADATPVEKDTNEFAIFYAGRVDNLKFLKGRIDIALKDKIKPFTEKILGSSDVPLDFTTSDFLVHDLAFFLVTSHGGLSAIESTSNPDIDWLSFLDFAETFSRDNVRVQARYEGTKVNEALRRLMRYTYAGAFIENDKLTFARFTTPSSFSTLLSDASILDLALEINDADIVNKQHVYADFDQTSDFWKIDAFDEASASVNSYGLREFVEKDETVWYTNSASALNLAERRTTILRDPIDRFKIQTPLVALGRQIGEVIRFTDSFFGVTSTDAFRMMGYQLDLDRGKMSLEIDESQIFTGFRLDDAVDGLLDQDYNFLL